MDVSFEPLSPVSFLRRAAHVYADRLAVIDEARRTSYGELWRRCTRLAGALRALGVADGDRVAVLLPNTQPMLEAHFGVPLAGAVLVALNVRLSAAELAYIVTHSGARVLLHDAEFDALAAATVSELGAAAPRTVRVAPSGERGSGADYDTLLESAQPHEAAVADERGLLAINYTSGTTGRPKGVMYHHRGAYLQALAMALHGGLDNATRYLWTLPMFHCNGWCFPWAVTAAGGVHVCLRRIDPARIWQLLRDEGITHLHAAPTVVLMLAWHPDAAAGAQRVRIGTGGAPPTPAMLERMEQLGIEMTHLYGLTETFGPIVVCVWRPEWNALALDAQARLKARQGVGNVIAQDVRVVDGEGRDVPADGATLGEIALRGNNVMLGYYRDEEATRRACPDGWLRSGDVGVMHPDGYVELRDRSKDVIISGGENIASVEVEQALAAHPAVLEAAVVAAPDAKWGEVPVAFVTLKDGAQVDAEALVAHLRARLAHFKVPRRYLFGALPKTATGKIQKFRLRERAREQAAEDATSVAGPDAATRALLDAVRAQGRQPLHGLDVAQARSFPSWVRLLFGPAPQLARTAEVTLRGAGGAALHARLYVDTADADCLIVYFHGGGWVLGSVDDFDAYTAELARRSGCAVLSVDYRLAPEHPFPTPVDDADAALGDALAQADALLGRPLRRLVAMGDSAGANLVAAVARRRARRGEPRAIDLQVLLYPVTDAACDTPSYRAFADGYLLRASDMHWFWQHYCADPARRLHPDASPLRADDLGGLPRTLLFSAEFDPLRDEGEAYGRRLQAAGVDCTLVRCAGVLHSFVAMVNRLPAAAAAFDDVCRRLRAAIAG